MTIEIFGGTGASDPPQLVQSRSQDRPAESAADSADAEDAASALCGGDPYTKRERLLCEEEGCVVFNTQRQVLFLSRGLRNLLAISPGDLDSSTMPDLLLPLLHDGSGRASTSFRLWLETGLAVAPDQHREPLRLEIEHSRRLEIALQGLEEGLWALSVQEYASERGGQSELFSVLYRDGLTGAANRALFEHKLDIALEGVAHGLDESVTVMLLDLDRFKMVNDTLGHPMGDRLLALVGERLRTSLRESDTLARLGGDEFSILMRNELNPQRITELARRLLDLLQRPYLVDGHILNIGVSIGVVRAPVDGTSRDQLMRRADLALYHSKGAGRNTFHFFTPAMEERAQNRRALELDLRKAVVLRQLELHYQPQIDVEKRCIIGLEGLLRWRHPKRGLLTPSEFLPLADEIGLAFPIGDWVLRTACKDAANWPEPVPVAVNISPLQFESTDFLGSVQRALGLAQLPAGRLEIEITEDILLLRNTEHVRSTLAALQALGVNVVIDSFGAGLTSLGQLVSFSFDKIKIDRTLVSHTEESPKSRAILRAISVLGQSLGIATLAAGVETPEHLANVRYEGCHAVQGFFYSHAVPNGDISSLFSGLFREGLHQLEEVCQ